jgi:DNA processing protein
VSAEPPVLDPADPDPARQARLRGWLALQRASALHPREAAERLRETGDPLRALAALRRAAPDPAVLDRAVAALRACGAVAVPRDSPAFPARLAVFDDAPLLLLVQGDVAALHASCIAIVGARAPSAYGRAQAERFAAAFARAGAVVVSGLALGIDGIAHRAALDAGGRTLAVQACGPDRVYPHRHRELAARIRRSGALVTEFAPGTPPLPAHFPFRNRVISALSHAVLVVEARERSGSLVTARHAAEQSIEVHAIPGPLGAPTSAGTNRLLHDGAHVALEPDDLLRPLGLADAVPARAAAPAPAAARSGNAARIAACLADAPASPDELAARLGLAPAALAPHLLELELAGHVSADRDGRLRLVPPRGGL